MLTFGKSKAVDEGERSVRPLLKNEYLHRLGLLESSRSTFPWLIPRIPGSQVEVPRAPVSTEEPTSLKSRTETALKKYRGLSEDVGPFDKNSTVSYCWGERWASVSWDGTRWSWEKAWGRDDSRVWRTECPGDRCRTSSSFFVQLWDVPSLEWSRDESVVCCRAL